MKFFKLSVFESSGKILGVTLKGKDKCHREHFHLRDPRWDQQGQEQLLLYVSSFSLDATAACSASQHVFFFFFLDILLICLENLILWLLFEHHSFNFNNF